MKLLTLTDIANRSGSDQIVGLVEEGRTVHPELDRIGGRPIRGTSYKMRVRTGLPSAEFRGANEGVNISASTYGFRTVECFILSAAMQVDKAAADADEFGAASVLAEEADGQFKGLLAAYGNQFYYGTDKSKGFVGLSNLINTAKMGVNAGGNTANKCSSVYLVYNDVQGIYSIYGANGQLSMADEWRVQQVTKVVNEVTRAFDAYVNGLTGWLGLQFHEEAASRICNVDATHPPTDKLIAQAISKHPTGKKPSFMLMNREARLGLQESRATPENPWPQTPTESNGVPIVTTDSILNTEKVVAFA